MAATLIHNGTLLDIGERDITPRAGHSLSVVDGRIVEVGPADGFAARVAAGEVATVIDARRHLIVPGLVNTHHHLFQSLTRGAPHVQQARLFDWLRGLYPLWSKLDRRALRLAAQVSLTELVLHGVTTVSDHQYMFPPAGDACIEAVLEAADAVGVRVHICRGSMTLGVSGGGLPPDDCVERDADVLRDCQRVLDAWHDPRPYALRRIDLAPCSPFNVTRELLRDTAVLARERRVLLHTHLAETLDEERFCLDRYGCRPVDYLAELGWLGPDVYLAHCVHLSDAEVRRFAETDTGVAHCPSSNMRLGSGIAPLERLLEAGVRVGLGVDGSSSNDGGDLLAEARLAVLAARGLRGLAEQRRAVADDDRPPLLNAHMGLWLATRGGARLLNRLELGHLQPGAAADLALFRADDIALAGAVVQDPVAALVLGAAPRADHVFVAGRQILRDGVCAKQDVGALVAEFNQVVAERFRWQA